MKMRDGVELVLLAALWGASFLFMRVAAPALGPVWLIGVRVLLAGAALLPLLAQKNLLGDLRRYAGRLLLVGGLNSAAPFLLYAFASLSLPAGFTAILNGTTPLFGTLVAILWFKERLAPAQLVGFGLGFVGVVVLVGWQPVTLSQNFVVAVAAGLLGALMYAIAAPYIKRSLAGVPALVVATGSQLGAAVLLLPALPFTVPDQVPTLGVVAAVVALALFSTALAYVLYFRLIQNLGSTRALTVTYLIPLFAMLWGAVALGEAITLAMVLGCGLVLLGTAIANNLVGWRRL